LNVAWSWIFFGTPQPGGAFVEVVILWLAIVATPVAFFSHSKITGWVLPYLAWVSFAAVLNLAIWRLNVAAVSEISAHPRAGHSFMAFCVGAPTRGPQLPARLRDRFSTASRPSGQ
jgi:hypothetical protein